MKTLSYPALFLFLTCILRQSVWADDLTDAFNQAIQMVRNWKPRGTSDNPGTRPPPSSRPPGENDQEAQERKRRREEAAQARKRQREETARRREEAERQRELAVEKEKERIKENLSTLDRNLALASKTEKSSTTVVKPPVPNQGAVLTRQLELQSLMTSNGIPTGIQASPALKKAMLLNASTIREALGRGEKPPFQPLWEFYKFNRPVAYGLVPSEFRCAMVLSMTLGVEPGAGELSINDIRESGVRDTIARLLKSGEIRPINPAVTDSEIAKKYFIRAEQLATRLKTEVGPPLELDGKDARKSIEGRKGIIFFYHASWRPHGGNHIDLWSVDRTASDYSRRFEEAQKVWFWELK